jgi:hypothetical protein
MLRFFGRNNVGSGGQLWNAVAKANAQQRCVFSTDRFTLPVANDTNNEKRFTLPYEANDINNEKKGQDEEEVELHPHWASMEKRVRNRKPREVGDGPSGRGFVRPSAWDAGGGQEG